MRFESLLSLSLLVCTTIARGFKDTAPFLLVSSHSPPDLLKDTLGAEQQQIQRLPPLLDLTHDFLRNVDSDITILLTRPVSGLKELALSKKIHTSVKVPEVLGVSATVQSALGNFLLQNNGMTEVLTTENARFFLRRSDASENTQKRIESLGLAGWFSQQEYLSAVDVSELLNLKTAFTLIYLGLPNEGTEDSQSTDQYLENTWEQEFASSLHVDLRRDLSTKESSEDDSGNNGSGSGDASDERGLFETYQFFTPGIFMGILTTLIMLAIGSVGLNAVSSLAVSYGAFDKENGPNAVASGKKQ